MTVRSYKVVPVTFTGSSFSRGMEGELYRKFFKVGIVKAFPKEKLLSSHHICLIDGQVDRCL